MTRFAFAFALILPFILKSQINYPIEPSAYSYDDMGSHYFSLTDYLGMSNSKQKQSLLRIKDVKSVTTKSVYISKKNKKQETNSFTSLNNFGRVLEIKSDYGHKKFEYESDTLLTYGSEKYKKTLLEKKFFYENGKRIKMESFRNSKLISSKEFAYNAAGKLVISKWKYKRNWGEMKYTYNAQNKLSRSEQYRKGKLKNVWVYDCKPEGQDLASAKNEILSSTCTYNEENADGSYIVFKRDIKYGKPYLLKQHFAKDSVLFLSEYFENDTILVSANRFNASTQTWTNNNYRKNKLISQEIVKYGDHKRAVSWEIYSGKNRAWRQTGMKLRHYNKNEYDNKGRLITEIRGSGKNMENVRKQVYEYNEMDLVIGSKTYFNERLTNEEQIIYSYHDK